MAVQPSLALLPKNLPWLDRLHIVFCLETASAVAFAFDITYTYAGVVEISIKNFGLTQRSDLPIGVQPVKQS